MTETSDCDLKNPPAGGEVRQPVWQALGMSRATWYRKGKPEKKPGKKITQKEVAALMRVTVRSVQRAIRILREAPELVPLVKAGKLKAGPVESLIIGTHKFVDS
jgi:hypothetical protein